MWYNIEWYLKFSLLNGQGTRIFCPRQLPFGTLFLRSNMMHSENQTMNIYPDHYVILSPSWCNFARLVLFWSS